MLKKSVKNNSKILADAKRIVGAYKITYEFEDGEYFGNSKEMPMVFGDGKTIDECVKDTTEATIAAVEYLLEKKMSIPESSKHCFL